MQNNTDKTKEQLIEDNNQLQNKILELENLIKQIKNNYNKIANDKVDFFKNISHNLRISLNGIIGMAEMLKQTPVNEIQKDYINIITNSSNSLLNSINKIFDYLLIENKAITIENKEFNIRKLISDSIEHFSLDAKEKNINLKYKVDEKIPDILIGDANHLTQIIYNLLSVLIFNSKNGNINIELSNVNTGNINKQKIEFKISNNSISLKNKNNENIKAVIESLKPINPFPDSLIGINIINSKEIIHFFNEELSFGYKNENESEFTFNLTFDKIFKKIIPSKPDETQKGTSKKLSVLLIEDNLLNRKFAIAILKKAGYDYDIAENGKIGIKKFKEKKYDLILMDIQMPIMDGIIATKKIREIEKQRGTKDRVIIIAVTAYALENDRKNCLEAGMDEYISKPYKPFELKNIIGKFF